MPWATCKPSEWMLVSEQFSAAGTMPLPNQTELAHLLGAVDEVGAAAANADGVGMPVAAACVN